MFNRSIHCARIRRRGWVTLHLLWGIGMWGAGCSEPEWLDLKVLTSNGSDPFATVDRLRLAVSDPASEQIITITDREHFELDLEVEVDSQIGMIALEGYAGQQLVARGETPPIVMTPTTQQLNLMVAPAGAMSPLSTNLEHPAEGMMSLLIPSMGVLLAGGRGAQGQLLTSAFVYDFFIHELLPLNAMPNGQTAGISATCGSYCGLLALGESDNGLATTIQRFESRVWNEYGDQLPPTERRRHASSVRMEDGISLVIGGEGANGALDTILSLNPGTLYMEPKMEVMEYRTREARVKPALALGTGAVVIVGGQPKGGKPAEILYVAAASAQDLTLEGPRIASGAAALSFVDGRVLVIGGRDEEGALLRDAWIINTVSLEVNHLPQTLAEGRADHRILRVGEHLVVVGGVIEAGLADQVEVLTAEGLTAVAQPVMQAPRAGFVVERLGVGSFLLAGGVGPAGPEPLLEIYQTSESLW